MLKEDYLKKYNFGLKDAAAKAIFTSEENKEYLSVVISKVLRIDKDYIMQHLKFVKTEITSNVKEKKADLDALYETNNLTINIEYNNFDYQDYLNKNMRYVFKLYVDSFISGTYKHKKAVQINFDCFDRFKENELIYEIGLYEKKYHKLYSDDVIIYSVNLAKINKMSYSEIVSKGTSSLEYLTYILVSKGIYDFENIYKKDKLMKQMVNKLKKMSNSKYADLYYDKDALDEKVFKEMSFDMGKTEGIAEGEISGILKEKIAVMQNMLNENESKEKIMKYLNLNSEEYTEILAKINK